MKASVPDGAGSVVLRDDVDEPTPGTDEVVVAVEAFSINRGETFQLESPRPGWRPGKDVAGTVIRPARESSGPAVGTRIVGHPPHGGWAERVAVSVRQLAELPGSLDTTVAAGLPLAGLTALRVLRAVGALSSKRLLITGASGGVGHYLVELAAAQGAVITALAGSLERGRRLRELGAEEVINDLDASDGRFDVVIDSVGGDLLQRAWRRLTNDGLVLWMGQASRTPPTLDFLDWTGGSNARMRKFHYADSSFSDADDLATLVRLVGHGHLHPQIDEVHHWTQAPSVLNQLLSRRIRGKAVLEVS